MVDRKRMERALGESDERFRGLVESSFDGIVSVDLEGRFTYVSPAIERIYGYRAEEIVGRVFKDFVPESEVPRIAQFFAESLKGRAIEGLRFDAVRKDGSVASIEANISPMLKDGKVVAIQGTVRDITERKQMEEKLRESEERLSHFLENAPDAIYVNDLNGNFMYGNRQAEKMVGYNREELIGKNMLEVGLLPEKYVPKVIGDLEASMRGERTGPHEYELIRKDGSTISVEISTIPVKRERKVEVIGIARDITERKQMEQELKLRAQLLDAVTDSVCVADSNGDIIYVNEAAYRSRGYGKDELLKMNLYELSRSAGFEGTSIKELFEKGEAIFESVGVRKDKSMMPVEVHARTIGTGGRKLILAVARDITERKKVEEMKNRFISAATHELRTPLVSIKGYVDYILTGKLGPVPEKARSGLEVVKRNTDRLLRIADDLLDIQRLAFGKLPLYLEPLRFREVIDHCVSEIKPFIDEKRQSFHLEAPEGPLLVQGDRIRLSQVVMNLLSNAVKFTPEAGSITLRVEDKEDAIQIQVSDTGIGIRKEDLEKVSQPFADIKKPAYVKGTGLGLSVAKGLVEAHGGRIWAESEGEGKGSTFTFTLPKRREGAQ